MATTVLRDIGLYKSRLIAAIQDFPDIKDLLLVGQEYSDEMWYGNDEDGDDLGILYKQLFPYLYLDETQTTVKAYVCCEVDVPRIPNGSIKDMKIVVWCLCHKSSMHIRQKDYSGTRADMLADAVDRAIRSYEAESKSNKKANLGIGDLELSSVTYISSINKEFYGRQLIYTVSDFAVKG